jgi:hypothetical protein
MEFTRQLTLGLRELLSGLRLQQITESFDLHQTELAVLKRTARKLARFGEPDLRMEAAYATQDRLDNCQTAMQPKFGHILACGTAWACKEGRNALIEHLSRDWLGDRHQLCHAWFKGL